jgi:hypothetical protein
VRTYPGVPASLTLERELEPDEARHWFALSQPGD